MEIRPAVLETDGRAILIDALQGQERVWKGQTDGGWRENINTKNEDDEMSNL
jgi:hypothetical protein